MGTSPLGEGAQVTIVETFRPNTRSRRITSTSVPADVLIAYSDLSRSTRRLFDLAIVSSDAQPPSAERAPMVQPDAWLELTERLFRHAQN